MGTSLVITIDVEEDSPKWQPEYPYTLNNINDIPSLQELFDKYNIKPTYLLTHSVASDKTCIDIFKKIHDKGKCEIGTHLHPWTNPPIEDNERLVATFPCDLSDELLRGKIGRLSEVIYDSFGIFAKSYRAGRYGLDLRTVDLLKKYSYIVDTSITPYVSWKRRDGELSFINAPVTPYFISRDDLLREGNSSILEVPLTIIYAKKRFYQKPSPIWFRPSYSTYWQMRNIIDILVNDGTPVLNMMFHSNEISLGQSIFSKNIRQVKSYWKKLDEIFHYIIRQNFIVSKTLSEVANEYHR
ncbi:MAG: hypothetical protein HY934_02105 [Candidatus Firestonebacteria bacterium]|nr:hypothetical protein [Candidatus Firestonebacteria bacterium]